MKIIKNGDIIELPTSFDNISNPTLEDMQSLGWTEYVEPVQTPYTPTYQELRVMAYPPVSEYLDAVVKGDQDQIDKYIADCLAVKAKYPKP